MLLGLALKTGVAAVLMETEEAVVLTEVVDMEVAGVDMVAVAAVAVVGIEDTKLPPDLVLLNRQIVFTRL